MNALKPILVLDKYVPHEYSSNLQVLASIQILNTLKDFHILMSIISLYVYVDLKYMIYAVYTCMIDLSH
jgi:hypothetical protein